MTKKKSQEEEKIKTTHETHKLQCALSEQEVAAAADELARGLDEFEALEDEKKSLVEDFKARLAVEEANIKVNRNLVRNKYTYKDVECELVLNYSELTATLTRTDTNEVVKERPMSSAEKQMNFEFNNQEEPAEAA